MNNKDGLREEIVRIRRVADMLCTGHASLRDRFARMALILDLSLIALATWIAALAFVAPNLNVSLTPFGLDSQLWGGLLAVAALFFAVVQLRTDWKGRSDGHGRTMDIYAEVKREAGYLLANADFDESECRRVLNRYDLASAVGLEIPERFFLKQKRRHLLKIAVSRYLDSHPGASLGLTRLRICWKDNFGNTKPDA